MAELIARSPGEGLLPLEIGGVRLEEENQGALTSVGVFKGQEGALEKALKSAHGMGLPGPNRATGKAGKRAIWFGRAHIMLAGPSPDPALAAYAALTDQSDAWASVTLSGEGAEAVLARLVPVDLRRAAFKRGHSVRTQLMHLSVSITRTGDNAFLILAFRSMADTLVHDLKTAMEAVAARG